MRKDKGMNGDGDRLPMLTWIMFLKFLDDNENLQEVNAQLEGKKYKSAIAEPYRCFARLYYMHWIRVPVRVPLLRLLQIADRYALLI